MVIQQKHKRSVRNIVNEQCNKHTVTGREDSNDVARRATVNRAKYVDGEYREESWENSATQLEDMNTISLQQNPLLTYVRESGKEGVQRRLKKKKLSGCRIFPFRHPLVTVFEQKGVVNLIAAVG